MGVPRQHITPAATWLHSTEYKCICARHTALESSRAPQTVHLWTRWLLTVLLVRKARRSTNTLLSAVSDKTSSDTSRSSAAEQELHRNVWPRVAPRPHQRRPPKCLLSTRSGTFVTGFASTSAASTPYITPR